MVNRKKINDFLESGKGKDDIEELLQREEFREEYLEQARLEAALYQVWEEKSSLKLKRKPVRIPLFKILALAAVLCIGFIIYKNTFSDIAIRVKTAEKVNAGDVFQTSEIVTYELKDGSIITMTGPSRIKFTDGNNIEIYEGFLEAKIKPRPNNKLTLKTPSGSFTVIGTEFSLWVNDESTLLNVTEGTVKVEDKFIHTNEKALLKKTGELITKDADLEYLSASLLLKKFAAMPTASIVSDFSVSKGSISNMVTGERISLKYGIRESKNGLSFNEQGALKIKPVYNSGLDWSLSMWLKFDMPKDRKAIVSHENFEDKNMGGWNLYYFNNYMRLHTVKQPYFHDQGDLPQSSTGWFHLCINVKALGNGKIEEKLYIDGELKNTHQRIMLFLKENEDFYLGGLSKNAMSAFPEHLKAENFYFKGEMGNLVYMNSLLSEAQIKSLYNSSKEIFK